ncbi:Probably glycosyltransferase [gamma proteobacterium HdN1]|nr:Probably glycosyltransferase [gamma proteobacterium HdN1]
MIPDRFFPWIRYVVTHKRFPQLNPPLRWSEKVLFWQMFDYSPKRRIFADKLAVRDYITQHGFGEFLPKLHGVYERVADIDLNRLPEKFVVKGNHGCDFNYFVRDKSKLDVAELDSVCQRWLSVDFYYYRREWYYEHLPRRIMIEEFVRGPEGKVPWDYKIFVTNGKPRLVIVDIDRFNGHKRLVYDANWQLVPIKYEKGDYLLPVERPKQLDRMFEIATQLAGDMQFVRVDFFVVGDSFVLGEISNSAGGGNIIIEPDEGDLQVGEWLGPCRAIPPGAALSGAPN